MSKSMAALAIFFSTQLSFSAASSYAFVESDPVSETRVERYVADLQDTLAQALVGVGTDEVARVVRDALTGQDAVDVRDLNAFVKTHTGGKTFLIPVAVQKKVIDYANVRIRRAGLDCFEFVADPALAPIDLDQPTPGLEKKHANWMTFRKWTIPTVALGAGVVGGLLNQQIESGIAVGVTSLALEYQFAHFNTWWNKHAWSRYGFSASVAVNLMYPLVNKLAELVTHVGAITVRGDAANLAQTFDLALASTLHGASLSEFAVAVTFNAATFVASFGAVQIALAKLKEVGAFGETKRFIKDTTLSVIGNAGRVLGMVSNSLSSGERSGESWGAFEPMNIANWSPSQWIGSLFQVGILTTYTIPLWTKLSVGDAAFDRYTAYLAEVKAGREAAHAWHDKPLQRLCNRLLARF